jgi:hypothetical protein
MTTIRDADLEEYLRVFHETYFETAQDILPASLREELLRPPLVQAGGIRGYISTQLGAGYEYTGFPPPGITVEHSSQRIEEFFLGTPRAASRLALGINVEGGDLLLDHVGFSGLFPFRLRHPAYVRLQAVDVNIGRWHRNVIYGEISTDRSQEFWSVESAIRRAKDELLIASVDSLQLERATKLGALSLGDYLTRFREQHVLVCGDFKSGRDRINRIADIVRDSGDEPIILDEDVPDILSQDLRQKFKAVAPVMRFVVIDDSSAAGQMVEVELADAGRWVTIVLRLSGTTSSYMTRGAQAASQVLREIEYRQDDLEAVLSEQMKWAEGCLEELQRVHTPTFPWRDPSKQSRGPNVTDSG